jgi:hypothetical protein
VAVCNVHRELVDVDLLSLDEDFAGRSDIFVEIGKIKI